MTLIAKVALGVLFFSGIAAILLFPVQELFGNYGVNQNTSFITRYDKSVELGLLSESSRESMFTDSEFDESSFLSLAVNGFRVAASVFSNLGSILTEFFNNVVEDIGIPFLIPALVVAAFVLWVAISYAEGFLGFDR